MTGEKKYVEIGAVIALIEKAADGYLYVETPKDNLIADVNAIPAADVVEVDDVAKMLTWLFADYCPCNYNDIDEWLPPVCELSNECPSPKDELGCWKQFIKHHKAKMYGGAER